MRTGCGTCLVSGLPLVALIVLLAVALGLRVFALDRPLQYDEVYTARLFVLQQGDPEFLARLPYHSNNHLLNTWMARRCVDLLGTSDLALRLPSFVCGLLHVLVVFALVRFLFGAMPAFWAASILAISPLPIYFDTACRGYASMMLFLALCVWMWLVCGRSPSWKSWIGFAASAVLLLLANPFGIVPLGILVVVGLVLKVPGGKRVRFVPLALSLCAIAATTIAVYSTQVPFLEYLAHWWNHGRLPETSFVRYASANEPVTGAFLLELWTLFAGGEGWARLLVLGALAGAGAAVGVARGQDPAETARRRYGVQVCLAFLVLPLAFCALVGLEVLPRLFSFGAAFLSALCALGLWGIGAPVARRWPGRAGLSPAISVVGLATLAVAAHWPPRGEWPDEGRLVDMRAVARWLDARRQPLDFVVTNTAGDQAGGINLPLKWYLDPELPAADPASLLSEASNIWTVATRETMPPVSPTQRVGQPGDFDHIRVQAYERRFGMVRQPACAGTAPPPLVVRQHDRNGAVLPSETLAQPEAGPIWSFRPAPGAGRAILYLPPVPARSQQPVVYALAVDGVEEMHVALACEKPGGKGVWPFDFRTVRPRPDPDRMPRAYLAVTEPGTILIRLMLDLRGLDPEREVRIGPVSLYLGGQASVPNAPRAPRHPRRRSRRSRRDIRACSGSRPPGSPCRARCRRERPSFCGRTPPG
ncbi:MAG: glycosyltransferase family 39 protein [Planctomycetes bacterium]|nr:glycosyltransferase family 39 protein [Planctomycetota bacterium]